MTVGQEPTGIAVGAGGGCLDIFTLLYIFSPLSPFLWETARYRLKFSLKGPLDKKNEEINNNFCNCFFSDLNVLEREREKEERMDR